MSTENPTITAMHDAYRALGTSVNQIHASELQQDFMRAAVAAMPAILELVAENERLSADLKTQCESRRIWELAAHYWKGNHDSLQNGLQVWAETAGRHQRENERVRAEFAEGRKNAFAWGWRTAALWADRDDLIADIESPAYIKERDDALARSASTEKNDE
jgi:hypothetical protein